MKINYKGLVNKMTMRKLKEVRSKETFIAYNKVNVNYAKCSELVKGSITRYIERTEKLTYGLYLGYLEWLAAKAYKENRMEDFWQVVHYEDKFYSYVKETEQVDYTLTRVLRSLYGGLQQHRNWLTTVNDLAVHKERKRYLWKLLSGKEVPIGML